MAIGVFESTVSVTVFGLGGVCGYHIRATVSVTVFGDNISVSIFGGTVSVILWGHHIGDTL